MITKHLKKIRHTKLWATTINILLIVVLINLIVNFFPVGFDLTTEKVHSLTKETKEILSGLDDIVTIKAFVSSNLPTQLIPPKRVLENILSQYKKLSRGKIKVVWVDPQKTEEAEREALSLGITPIQFSSVQKDQFQVVQGYFGLAVFHAGESETISVLEEINNIEYQLSSEIKKIQTEELTKVGVSSGLGETERANLQNINKLLSSTYQAVNIDLSEESSFDQKGIKTLVIIGPQEEFSSGAKLFIDQMLMDQKGILLLLNQIAVDEGLIAQKTDNALDNFLGYYGVRVNNDLVVDLSSGFASFRTQSGNFVIPYPFWVKTRAENRDPDLPITSSLESVVLPWVSSINLDKGAVPVWKSTQRSIVTTNTQNLSPDQEWDFSDPEKTSQSVLAAIQTNGFDSYFSQDSLPETEIKGLDLEEIKKKTDSLKLAVVADANFVEDQTLNSNPENAQLFMNLVDYLSQETELIGIRSKAILSRPLKPIEENQKQIVKSVSLVTGPVLLLTTALAIRWQRKKKHQTNQENNYRNV